mmetsp:Transcript_16592/g.49650  ORF Transcript_16592/g.49650 Transcript_16592/m.49650 type:complete len:234 (+) Transcript_16592:543-1244(+)
MLAATSLSRFFMTFLPASRLARAMRSLARWQASEACPKGMSSAGAPISFSKALATGMVPPSRTNRGGCPHWAVTARSAMRKRVDSGSASHQSPVLRRVTFTLLALRSLRNSCCTCALNNSVRREASWSGTKRMDTWPVAVRGTTLKRVGPKRYVVSPSAPGPLAAAAARSSPILTSTTDKLGSHHLALSKSRLEVCCTKEGTPRAARYPSSWNSEDCSSRESAASSMPSLTPS